MKNKKLVMFLGALIFCISVVLIAIFVRPSSTVYELRDLALMITPLVMIAGLIFLVVWIFWKHKK